MSDEPQTPVFIVMSGLPGSGKTTVSKALAKNIGATYLRVDTIEQAIVRSEFGVQDVKGLGYEVLCEVAYDNLIAGQNVIADSVNDIQITRDMYADIAKRAGAKLFNLEVICSDKKEHRRRVEARVADIEGHDMPTWQDVLDRDYLAWGEGEAMQVDTYQNDLGVIISNIKRHFTN